MPNFDPNLPFNRLPDIVAGEDYESRDVLKQAIRTHRTLAKLRSTGRTVPTVLKAESWITLFNSTRDGRESECGSDEDVLLQYFGGPANLITRCQDGLWKAYHVVTDAGRIDLVLLETIVQAATGKPAELRRGPGKPCVDKESGETLYTPPEGESLIRQKLANLLKYLNDTKDETEVLVRMSIIYFQIESIQPFEIDITGILLVMLLIQSDLLDIPVLYIGDVLEKNGSLYNKKIKKLREEGKWKQWVLFMLEIIERACIVTDNKLKKLISNAEELDRYIRQRAPEIYSKELVELLCAKPFCKRRFLVDAKIVKTKTAGLYLLRLEEIGLLKSRRVGKEKFYFNNKYLSGFLH